MELRLYDTLSKEKRAFVPLDPNNVRMYVCGPTVYDFAHIGNARPVIVFDVMFRLLRQVYGADHVTYVRNITDVDDKINDRAARDFPGLPLNEAIRKVTETTAAQFHADVAALGCLPPTFEPRATDFVLPRADGKADMVTLIKQLIARGHAYEAGGEVLFDTQSMPDYGALSGRKLDEQLAGARVAVDAHKKNPADFVLWKQSSENEPGWESPWGRGRPGWHIECSAMSAAYLGDVFDIHGGGLDLIFPHHENEIAQSRCAHGTHDDGELLDAQRLPAGRRREDVEEPRQLRHDPRAAGGLAGRSAAPQHAEDALPLADRLDVEGIGREREDARRLVLGRCRSCRADRPSDGVIEALSDDLNTPQMTASLHSLRNSAASGNERDRAAFAASLRLLGFLSESSADWNKRKQQASGIDAKQVDALISDRTAARARKDFKESDRIRDELAAMGVVIKDSKDGTTWEVAR